MIVAEHEGNGFGCERIFVQIEGKRLIDRGGEFDDGDDAFRIGELKRGERDREPAL